MIGIYTTASSLILRLKEDAPQEPFLIKGLLGQVEVAPSPLQGPTAVGRSVGVSAEGHKAKAESRAMTVYAPSEQDAKEAYETR